MSHNDEAAMPLHRRKLSFGATVRAVAWSFFGVRKARDLESDAAQLNPVHLVIAGIIGAALFVVALILLIDWVIASGVAT